MNIKNLKSEFVEIEGLTEAAIASPDIQLVAILDYLATATSYLSEKDLGDDLPMHPVLQVRESCITELMRRHGSNYDLSKDIKCNLPEFFDAEVSRILM
ncbi:MAG: hypothetical protein R8K22_03145 [Mariprofundaceae bacterium]